jgi:hypothetical protein
MLPCIISSQFDFLSIGDVTAERVDGIDDEDDEVECSCGVELKGKG